MEDKIIFEVTNGKHGYDLQLYNESHSIHRTYQLGSQVKLGNIINIVVPELLGEPNNEEDEKVALIEENEEAMAEYFMENEYHGSKDGWEDAYANWESNLVLEDVKKILATQPKETEQPNVTGV